MPRTTSSIAYSEMVGAVLRARRIEAGLTQTQVGERLDVSQSYVNRMESGRINMTIGQLGRVCEALGATLRVRLDVPERDPLLDRMLDGARPTAGRRT
jgi:transcriptional regulator with XRE-family HTH domain